MGRMTKRAEIVTSWSYRRRTGKVSLKDSNKKAREVMSTGPWVTQKAGGDNWLSLQ